MSNAPNASNTPGASVPDSALTREQLYERIRASSKQEVVLEEMQRLGFWPRDAGQPTVEEQLIRRESELQTTLEQLSTELRGIGNREQALKSLRKERMAAALIRREETRQKLALLRHERALAWHGRRQNELLYVGQGVSAGLNDAQSRPEALARHALPVLNTASDLAQAMGLDLSELRFLAWHREVARISHYQRFTLPKKSGGERRISAPMPRLKRAQYWVLDSILSKVSTHDAAHGFVPGRSILSNAAPHVGQDVVVNLDLKDFFPSIGWRRVRGVFRELGYSQQVASLLALLCTEAPTDEVSIDGARYFVATGERVLPQGAPTSPMLTNVLCRRLDARLAACAAKLGFRYTRYADDLSFSAGPEQRREVGKLLWCVKQIVSGEGFTPHPEKQEVMRRHQQQHVTGLVVNDKLSLDRDTLRRFRAVLHQAETKGLSGLHWNGNPDLLGALAGYANFIAMADPARGQPYVQRVRALRARHGAAFVPDAAAAATAAAPVRPRLPAGHFRTQSARGQAPWPSWWQPAPPPAPVLEKTAEQIAAEKKAVREAARAQTAAAATPTVPAPAAMPRAPASASTAPDSIERDPLYPTVHLWVGLAMQILCAFPLLLLPGRKTMFLAAMGVVGFNAFRRQAHWGRYWLAVGLGFVAWLLLG